jgi:hypothetical protein
LGQLVRLNQATIERQQGEPGEALQHRGANDLRKLSDVIALPDGVEYFRTQS